MASGTGRTTDSASGGEGEVVIDTFGVEAEATMPVVGGTSEPEADVYDSAGLTGEPEEDDSIDVGGVFDSAGFAPGIPRRAGLLTEAPMRME